MPTDKEILEGYLFKPIKVKKRKKFYIQNIDKLTLLSIIISAIACISAILIPEIRRIIGLDEIPQKPFRVEYTISDGGGFVVNESKEIDNPGVYRAQKRTIPSDPEITIDLIGLNNDEKIKIASYLIISMTSTTPITKITNYVHGQQIGAGGCYDNFEGVLSPHQERIFGAPALYWTSSCDNRNIEFFTLSHNERESFKLKILSYPGYYYNFKVGVLYQYRGSQQIEWLEKEIFAASPIHTISWRWNLPYNNETSSYSRFEDPGQSRFTAKTLDDQDNYLRNKITDHNNILYKNRAFLFNNILQK